MCDYNSYQKSISNELKSLQNRVRNFIGDHHWGEDGRYKEIILRDIIAEKLPNFASCGTGFIVGKEYKISTQIDILVYRNDIPLLFKKGDFIIVPQEAVLGIVEVKSRLDSGKIEETVRKAHENGKLVKQNIFNGIFSYDNYDVLPDGQLHLANTLERVLRSYAGKVNYISFGKDYFLKYWKDGEPYNQQGNKYRLYKIVDLAFGYFISNLIEDIYIVAQDKSIPETLKKVFYPIEGTKEVDGVETLIL